MLDRLSLKARLLLGVIVLSAIGLGARPISPRSPPSASFLLDRTDESLETLSSAAGFEVS